MNKVITLLITVAMLALLGIAPSVEAGDKAFPKNVETLLGSPPEGFAIGEGSTAYNSSPLGSIYKVDLSSGQGEILVPVSNPDIFTACELLGMRVDSRTNYLFAAGCFHGNAKVYDAETGALLMEYQLNVSEEFGIINDLTITEDAVFFTDSYRPVLYRLPLTEEGAIPLNSSTVTEIPLPDEFAMDPNGPCCGGNGIVSTPNGKTLIIGHSNLSRIYRVDVASGDVDQIYLDEPLTGFLDGIAMRSKSLYILTPFYFDDGIDYFDGIQVVNMEKGNLSGTVGETITNPAFDGVASGAFFGNSLYVNNAKYTTFPEASTPYSLTKLSIK